MMESNKGPVGGGLLSPPTSFITTSIQLDQVPLGLPRICLYADSSDVAAGQTLSGGMI